MISNLFSAVCADPSYSDIILDIQHYGEHRETRTGGVTTTFSPPDFRWDMADGFPLLTGKRIFVQPMVGELLWFMGGDHSITQLIERTWCGDEAYGQAEPRKTIWTPDQERWYNSLPKSQQEQLKYFDDCGRIYGRQWRNSAGKFGTQVDQLDKLIRVLKDNPDGRYHIVNSWNAAEIDANMMALPPCHVMFQCFVSNDGHLSLKWYQRSVDVFLGLPFNIASYGLLLEILAKLCGYKPGKLIGTFGDAQIYDAHKDAVKQYMQAPLFDAPKLVLPEFSTLEDVNNMTALDFKDSFADYQHSGVIKAPLSVG